MINMLFVVRVGNLLNSNYIIYIFFYGLTFRVLNIKSSLFVIANINDRSQLGDRDSEIAIVIEDKMKIETRMNGKPVSKI